MNPTPILFALTLVALTTFAFGQTPAAPTGLSAAWSSGSGGNRTVTLTWNDNADNETGYVVERKLPPPAAASWGEIASSLPAGTVTYDDTTVPANSAVNNCYYYRVRAKINTTKSGAAEVCTAGVTSTEVYDTDADGMTDAEETNLGFNPNDWTDGTGDFDGDGIPNTWEVRWGKDPKTTSSTEYDAAAISALNTGGYKWVTLNPALANNGTNAATFAQAFAKFPSTTHLSDSYTVIKVKPGVYIENVSKAATVLANVAVLTDRSQPSDVFEIRGGSATFTTYGSLVLDGFTLGRNTYAYRLFSVHEEAVPLNRISQVRLVNCMALGENTGADSIVEQTRSRLVISHCTFYQNTVTTAAAHAYNAGTDSTARLKVHNSIFWSTNKTDVPQFISVGDYTFTTSIVYQSQLPGMPLIPSGAEHVNPGLTPKGYVATPMSPAATGGTVNGQARLDMHGEVRFDPTGRGADEWDDADADGIPDFADLAPADASNAFLDNDGDLLSQLTEYLTSADYMIVDNPYLTLSQIYFTKAEVENLVYTKQQSDSRYLTESELDAAYWRKDEVLRVQPQGGLSMGEFTNGTLP